MLNLLDNLFRRGGWLLVACFALRGANAQTVPTGLTVETLAPGLAAPVAFEFLPGGRVLFAEQFTGRVRVWREGTGVQPLPVLIVPGVVAGNERGLLGLALDPAYPVRPYLYLFHDAPTPNHIRIVRYTLLGNLDDTSPGDLTADPLSRYDLIDDIPDAAGNHNGGTLHFGVEGLLYASIGEDAVPCAAQDSTSLRGVILRLRTDALPSGPGSAFRAQITPTDNPFAASADSNLRLVAALGLRNPFRFQIEPVTGVLVIGDVGESLREELNLLTPPIISINGAVPIAEVRAFPAAAGGAPLGANFGWPYLEGTSPGAHRNDCGLVPNALTAPVFDYDRTQQSFGAAIISAGAYTYYPSALRSWPASYSGNLFASDYYTGVLRRLTFTNSAWDLAPPVPGQPSVEAWGTGFAAVSDWREGPDGALWFCRQGVGAATSSGLLGRISGAFSPPPPPPSSPRIPITLDLFGSPAVGFAELRMTVNTTEPGQLTIHDLSGRVLRSWTHEEFLRFPASFGVSWDGRDADGNAVRPGIYVARLESQGQTASVRIPFLR